MTIDPFDGVKSSHQETHEKLEFLKTSSRDSHHETHRKLASLSRSEDLHSQIIKGDLISIQVTLWYLTGTAWLLVASGLLYAAYYYW